MEYKIYFLINKEKTKTYVGFTDNLQRRLAENRLGKTKSTQNFKIGLCTILEKVETIDIAIKREKYWKSCAGRKKLKKIFTKLKN